MIKYKYSFPTFGETILHTFELSKHWIGCNKCESIKNVNKMVFGSGNPNADILFVGEAPGLTENDTGVPFSGISGDLFNNFLEAINLNREDVFVDNVIICRPQSEERGKPTRVPTKEEIHNCSQRLYSTILELDPLLIVALGNTALQMLTSKNIQITKVRGDLLTAKIPGVKIVVEYPVIATYHPSYILRNQSTDGKGERSLKAQCLQDFIFAIKLVNLANSLYGRKFNGRKD